MIPTPAFAAETSYELMLLHLFMYLCLIISTIVLPFGFRRKGLLVVMYILCFLSLGLVFEEFKLRFNEGVMFAIPILLWILLVIIILKLKKHKILEDNTEPPGDDNTAFGP